MPDASSSTLADHALSLQKCTFCHDQCLTATPEVWASGRQNLALSRVAAALREIEDGRSTWTMGLSEAVFSSLNQSRQSQYCLYGRDFAPELHIRAAREEAVRRGFIPAAVGEVLVKLRQTGNVLGLKTVPSDAAPTSGGGLTLVHDAVTRGLNSASLAAARSILTFRHSDFNEVALSSAGMVEVDLGLTDWATKAALSGSRMLNESGDGPVVCIDPTVAVAIRLHWPAFGGAVNREVVTLPEFLDTEGGLPPMQQHSTTATFHDCGALGRQLGIFDAPRRLLRDVAGIEVIEPATTREQAADDGPYDGYPDIEIARRIAQSRVDELIRTGAALIVTASAYSRRNLSSSAGDVPVLDIAEVIWNALVANGSSATL